MTTHLRLMTVLIALGLSTSAHAQRAGASLSVQTGVVISASAVDLQSAIGGGALAGGIAGYALTSRNRGSSRRIRNTILGGAAGAAIANRAEGSRNGMQYTVEVGPGNRITVVTDQTEILVGDCVNVEQTGSGVANVRRVSPALCEAAASNSVDADITAEYDRLASMCLEAKDGMLDAKSNEALELAIRRVKILCDD